MKKKVLLILSFLLTFSITACGGEKKEPSSKENSSVLLEVPSASQNKNWFADLKTNDINGNPITGNLFKNKKITLINTWATFCGPCINEIPELEELYQEYKDGDLVGIAGLLVDSSSMKFRAGLSEEETETGKSIIEAAGVTYPQLTVSETLAQTDLSMISSFPTTYFVDENGFFVGEPVIGANSQETWKKIIEERLQMLE